MSVGPDFFTEEYYDHLISTEYKETFRVKSDLGAGYASSYHLCDGLYLIFSHYMMMEVEGDYDSILDGDIVLIHHFLQGNAWIHLENGLSGSFCSGDTMFFNGRVGGFKGWAGDSVVTCISFFGYRDALINTAQRLLAHEAETLSQVKQMLDGPSGFIIAPTAPEIGLQLQELHKRCLGDQPVRIRLAALDLFISDALYFEQYKNTRKGLYKHEYVLLIQDVAAYMQTHYDQPLTISQLAEHFGINRTYLKNIFTELYGMPPMTYLRNIRMSQAKDMILDGCSVLEAANAVGYANPSKFTQAFREKYHILPSKLRS